MRERDSSTSSSSSSSSSTTSSLASTPQQLRPALSSPAAAPAAGGGSGGGATGGGSGDADDISSDVWAEWILQAIRKIRSQKQRPSIQRICQAIGSHHKFHEDIVAAKLETAVAAGSVVKVYNKGLHSYKAPVPRRRVAVRADTDLSRLVAKAVRELGEWSGSSLRSIEVYVQKFSDITMKTDDADFRQVIKNSARIAVQKDMLAQEGKLYKWKAPSVKKKPAPATAVSGADGADDSVSKYFTIIGQSLVEKLQIIHYKVQIK